jgi:hypothetical protein
VITVPSYYILRKGHSRPQLPALYFLHSRFLEEY